VAYHYVFAVTAPFIAHTAHLSGESGAYGVAGIYFNVEPFVPPSMPPSEVRRKGTAHRWHTKVAQIYAERVGKVLPPMEKFVIPAVIKILGGRLKQLS